MLAVMTKKIYLLPAKSLLIKDRIKSLSYFFDNIHSLSSSFLLQVPELKFQNISPGPYFRRRLFFWKNIS